MTEIGKKFAAVCKERSWRRTPQRLAVYEYVHENYTHPSVDQVWETVRKQLPAVSRESIYRILNEFADAGIINRLDRIENARYDARTGPHGHFFCVCCEKIIDFPLSGKVELPPEFVDDEISHIELRLSGICPECRQKREKGSEKR